MTGVKVSTGRISRIWSHACDNYFLRYRPPLGQTHSSHRHVSNTRRSRSSLRTRLWLTRRVQETQGCSDLWYAICFCRVSIARCNSRYHWTGWIVSVSQAFTTALLVTPLAARSSCSIKATKCTGSFVARPASTLGGCTTFMLISTNVNLFFFVMVISMT